jgi:hypothetical protein
MPSPARQALFVTWRAPFPIVTEPSGAGRDDEMDDGWWVRAVAGRVPVLDERLRIEVRPVLAQTTLKVDGATGTTIDIEYASLPGNEPTTNKNFVAVWNGTIVPWGQAPLRTMEVPGDFVEGSMVIDGLSVSELAYTVGYGVGPDPADVCASAILGAGAQTGPTDAVSLSINRVGTTSVSVHYSVLDGYLPATNGNTIALWSGSVSPFTAPAPLARVRVPEDTTTGDVGFNGVVMQRSTTYTLAYFMGQAATTAAAVLTFSTSGT